MDIIRPNTIFFNIFDSIQACFASRRDAYEEAERRFGEMCVKGFGKAYRKFDSYESFLSAYNRETNKIISRKLPSLNDFTKDYVKF